MKILYNDNGIKILNPVLKDLDIIVLGEKDVPAGLPFILVKEEDLPSEPQETWEVDFSQPDGYGLSPSEFKLKYPELKNMGVIE